MELHLDDMIREFLRRAARWQATPGAARVVLEEVLRFYKEVRVEGADLDSEEDVLLLQWGRQKLIRVSQPSDLRGSTTEDLTTDPQSLPWLDFTRQVRATHGDPEIDPDAIAVDLSIEMSLKVPDDGSPGGQVWITQPDRIDAEIARYAAKPLVARGLAAIPARTVATVLRTEDR